MVITSSVVSWFAILTPINTSAFFKAVFRVPFVLYGLVYFKISRLKSFKSERSLCIIPFVSHMTICCTGVQTDLSISWHINNLEIANPAAPAPLMTTLSSPMFLFKSLHALIIPANTTIAVPCWSSWNTGIPNVCKRSSISKQRGEEISSRLIPPKTGAIFRMVWMISSVFCVARQIGKASMPANFLNNIAFPSITGIAASGPKFPKPKMAEPSVTTATQFPFMVKSQTFSSSLAIWRTGSATPGE